MKHLTVIAAIIINNNEILCLQRKESKYPYISKKYEFPGGKIEEGETKIQALKREIKEELNTEVDVGEKFTTVTHEYPDFSITMHCYFCSVNDRTMELKEHIDHKWLGTDLLHSLDWAEADLPVIKKLKNGIEK